MIWNATLKPDSEQVYFCLNNTGDLYCTTWQPSAAVFSGTFKEGSTPALTVGSATWVDTLGSAHTDSTPMTFTSAGDPCPFYTIRVAGSGNTLRGTWSLRTDCHSRHIVGSVVLTR